MRFASQDLRFAFRMLARTPGFAITAVVVIGLGIGANTATFSLIHELLLRPLPGREDGRLAGLYARERDRPDSWRLSSYPTYVDLRDGSDVFDSLAAYTFTLVAAGDDARTSRVLASVISANYFDTLGATLAAGRPFTLDEEGSAERRVVVASYARWRRVGFDRSFIGSTLQINGADYAVVGVAPEGFTGTMALLAPDVYLPLGAFGAVVGDRYKNNGRGLFDRSNRGLSLAGRLRPGMSPDEVASRLERMSSRLESAHPVEERGVLLSVHPLARLSAAPSPQSDSALAAFTSLLMGVSGIVLVIACLNVANMLLARGTSRRKELAVRLALGAGRGRVIRQLLTEGLLIATAGAGIGWLLSTWATSAIASALSGALPFAVRLQTRPDPAMLAVTSVLVFVATVSFALGPALRLSRRNPASDLLERAPESSSRRGLFRDRNVLVVAQVALSVALLTAGGIFLSTAVRAAGTGPGFSYDRLLVAHVDTRLAGLDEARGRVVLGDLLDRLRTTTGIDAAALTSSVPFGDSVESSDVEPVPARGVTARARAFRVVGADYFRTVGLTMLAGREFTEVEERSADAPAVAIVDDPLARALFGRTNVVGETIRLAGVPGGGRGAEQIPLTVIGVVPGLREEVLDPAPVPHLYVPFGRFARGGMYLHARTRSGVTERETLESVRGAIRGTGQGLPVLSLMTMADFHDQSLDLSALRAGAKAFAGLGIVGLALSALGVYGVMAYLVARRTREIGIRMALGATAGNVRRLVIGHGWRVTAVGIAIGLPLAILVSFALRSVFVEIGGLHWTIVAGSAALLVASATVACLAPVRRAVRVQPVEAIRTE
jgi:predicted permease